MNRLLALGVPGIVGTLRNPGMRNSALGQVYLFLKSIHSSSRRRSAYPLLATVSPSATEP